METKTPDTEVDPESDLDARHQAVPSSGLRPTPDPTRSGALWVGGAGVALLLAAAAALTAVRWDDIGQSAKLGGLVAITVAMLAAGRRLAHAIPMTAQAIFHLGALLIPFDMAAVAILAGRTWQETLLLTSLTSVVSWYGIERAVPSVVLRSAAAMGMVGLAAGVASVSALSTPLALAIAAAVAVVARKPAEATAWAMIAGVLPVAAFVTWPVRISAAMSDLGFDSADRWQPLAAGLTATLVLVAVTRLAPRIEIAWSAITIGVVTLLVALGGFADAEVSVLTVAGVFVGLELLALATTRDPLWKPLVAVMVAGAELFAGVTTALLFVGSVVVAGLRELSFGVATAPGSTLAIAAAAALFGVGWLIADRRRLDDPDDWLTAILIGSDWPVTTMMLPLAVVAAIVSFGAPPYVFAASAIALGYWMVSTWRAGSTYGAIALVSLAAVVATQVHPWVELVLGALGATVLMLAARQRISARDMGAAVVAAAGSVLVWLGASTGVVGSSETSWPLVVVLVGAWALSWLIEARANPIVRHPADLAGRIAGLSVMFASLLVEPAVAIVLCMTTALLAGFDHWAARRRGAAPGAFILTASAIVGGLAFGLAGVPATVALGLATAPAGAVLAIAAFVFVGIALVSPSELELPFGAASGAAMLVGLVMALGDPGMFAVAVMAAGCTLLFVAAALRDLSIGVIGYIGLGLGIALQLAVWDVSWLEAYLVMPAGAALFVGHHYQRNGGSSWAAYAPTIALLSYVSIADRFAGASGWHAVIAGAVGVIAIIAGGYRKLVGPLISGSAVLAIVVGYELLGPAALVPTWAWLAAGGTVLLSAGVMLERSDTTPLERGQQLRQVVATQFS